MLTTVDNATNHNYNLTIIDKSPLLNNQEDQIQSTQIIDQIQPDQIYLNDCPICLESLKDEDNINNYILVWLKLLYNTNGIPQTSRTLS